jgi:hypothetical protein
MRTCPRRCRGRDSSPRVSQLLTGSDQADRPLWRSGGRPGGTHPDQHGNGLARLMGLWVLGFAARRPGPASCWVRCMVPGARLAEYFREQLGWDEVRVTHDGAGRRCSPMQRAPYRQPEGDRLVDGTGLAIALSPPSP